MNHYNVEKFFNNTCSAEEAEQIVEWFATSDGQSYLLKRLDEDLALLEDERIKPLLPELESAGMWKEIKAGMSSSAKYKYVSYSNRNHAYYWYAAAAILFTILTSSAFFYWKQISEEQLSKNKRPVHYVAGPGQQIALALSDETTIRLNNDAELWILSNYGQKNREVKLKGEAYFKVNHNEDKPFIIHTRGVSIKDLGTSFSVRALPGEDNIQIAVKEGKVSVQTKLKSVKKVVNLVHGQFGYLDLTTDSISIDDFGVENYLSWMDHRFAFDSDPLEKVSEQLSHIYNISFKYSSDSLKKMKFSANFERNSLKKTLAVISLTLKISYRMKGNQVVWIKNNDES